MGKQGDTDKPNSSPTQGARFLGMSHVGWVALNSMGALFTMASFIAGVTQYSISLEAIRAEKTLELVADWRDEGFRDDYLSLAAFTRDQMTRISDAELALVRSDGRLRSRVSDKIAMEVLKAEPDAEAQLDDVVYFFNLLGLCVEARLCSKSTAANFFDSTILTFNGIFECEIMRRRRASPDYATGMTLLVTMLSEDAGSATDVIEEEQCFARSATLRSGGFSISTRRS